MHCESGDKPPPPSAQPAVGADDERRGKARKFFEHAKKAAEQRNYDYAIKLYTDGLALWPDAVEEGLKPLRVVATMRKLEGGKPAGFLAARKLSLSGKDPLKNLNNALHLYGLDPGSIPHMEQILELASRGMLYRVVWWIAPVLVEAYDTSGKKLAMSHYAAACAAMDHAAEFALQAGDERIQMEILQACIATAQIWAQHYPTSLDAQRARSDATGKLTITRGKFSRDGDITESMLDAERQADLRDRDKAIQSEERLAALIAKAREEWLAQREVPGKLINLVNLMLRADDPKADSEAIALLEAEYKATNNYAFKMKADDVRMRYFQRQLRQAVEKAEQSAGDAAAQQAVQELAARINEAELKIFAERREKYPTDLKLHFHHGVRLFKAGRFDEAIPLFQRSQGDGRLRLESRLYLGRCFFEKNFNDQAAGTLRAAVRDLETTAGKLPLELNYWLGRTLEKLGKKDEARAVYGELIQIDYNYRDARQRLERIVAGELD